VGTLSPQVQDWLTSVKERFDELKKSDEEKLIEHIPSYAVPFSEEIGSDYSLGKNDLRNWGSNMVNTLHYTPTQYTMREFYMNISHKPVEFMKLTLPAYIELENAIRKHMGYDDASLVTVNNIGLPEMQPFYILAIMASVDRSRLQVPIVASA